MISLSICSSVMATWLVLSLILVFFLLFSNNGMLFIALHRTYVKIIQLPWRPSPRSQDQRFPIHTLLVTVHSSLTSTLVRDRQGAHVDFSLKHMFVCQQTQRTNPDTWMGLSYMHICGDTQKNHLRNVCTHKSSSVHATLLP